MHQRFLDWNRSLPRSEQWAIGDNTHPDDFSWLPWYTFRPYVIEDLSDDEMREFEIAKVQQEYARRIRDIQEDYSVNIHNLLMDKNIKIQELYFKK